MSNVVEFKQITGTVAVNDTIMEFINEVGINSKSTREAYGSDLRQYINHVHASLYTQTKMVASSLNRKQLINYRAYLINEAGLKANTVNRKLSAIQEFCKFLYNNGYKVDLTGIQSVNKLKSPKNSYEVISYDEAMKIIDWFKDNEKEQSLEKYYYASLAFDTGVRAEALNTITPQSFTWKENEVILKGVDKGNKQFIKSLSIEFATRMFDEMNINISSNKPIFNFSSALRYKMMKRAKKALGWDNRNITFHSFKKGAVNYAYNATKDIQVAREVGNHSSVVTTQIYIEDNKEVFQGAISNKQSINHSNVKFADYSKEQLIEALGNMSEAMQVALKKELMSLQ